MLAKRMYVNEEDFPMCVGLYKRTHWCNYSYDKYLQIFKPHLQSVEKKISHLIYVKGKRVV